MGLTAKKGDPKERQVFSETLRTVAGIAAIVCFSIYLYYSPFRPLSEELNTVREMTISERMVYWSEFLQAEAPKFGHVAKLGGGPQVWDRLSLTPTVFSPLSFVETVVALSESESREDYYANILKLRYRHGKPHEKNRNFLASVQWIKENSKNGYLRDTTNELTKKKEIPELKLTVDIAKWLEKNEIERNLASFAKKSDSSVVEEVQMKHIPLSEIKKVRNRIVEGSILAVLGGNCKMDPVFCKMGVVTKKQGNEVVITRSAENGKIVSENLNDFMKLSSNQSVSGLSVFSVVRPL